ncbi:MAG TPA: Mur ligase family protein, partial [Thermoanaerobaculia bacterium]
MRPTEQTRLDIYVVAIGGTGMAPLACLLQEQGHRVRGTDGPLYPPMSTLLERAGIRPAVGYDAAHLEPAPDLVVVGNAVRSDNPEAIAAARLGVPVLSMPQALARFFLAGRRPLVVTGTHGKTTTTAMAAWVYSQCGADPGYLIGGVPHDLPGSFAAGGAAAAATVAGAAPAAPPAPASPASPAAARGRFIVEGDEYNAAYFDRGAKFLHYRPETLILTSVEYDHADLYASPEALREAYRQVIAQLPADGLLVACGDTREVRELARRAPCRTILYGLEEGNEVRPAGCAPTRSASRFRVADAGAGEVTIELPLAGAHNVANALAAAAAAASAGAALEHIVRGLSRVRAVPGRLQFRRAVGGGWLIDDSYNANPSSVRAAIEVLATLPGRRWLVLGDMAELGACALEEHVGLGEFARAHG